MTNIDRGKFLSVYNTLSKYKQDSKTIVSDPFLYKYCFYSIFLIDLIPSCPEMLKKRKLSHSQSK